MTPCADLDDRLDQFVRQTGDLYSLPRVAAEVLELTRDAAVDTARLKLCIEKDPALTAKLLRVVNSSLFGLCREVADLNQALALLGTKPLKLLVLGFSLPETLFRDIEEDLLGRYWRHTLSTAVAARELCHVLQLPCGDEAFIAGLLKHLGMLVLVQQVGPSYVRFVERMQIQSVPLLEVERMALGCDHTQLTARLLAHWRLPQSIVDIAAAGARLEGLAEPARRLGYLLMAGEDLARWLIDREEDALASAFQTLQRAAPASDAQFAAVLVCLREKVRQLADVLSIHLPDEQTNEQLSAEAYRQLAAAARSAAGLLLRAAHEPAGEPDQGWDYDADVLTSEETAAVRQSFATVLHDEQADTAAGRQPASEPAAVSAITIKSTVSTTPTTMSRSPDGNALLVEHVAEALAHCRRARTALSLAIVELDRFEELCLAIGRSQAVLLVQRLQQTCASLDHDGLTCLSGSDGGLVLLLPDCERQEAVRLVRSLLEFGGHRQSRRPAGASTAASISIGVAALEQTPRNFPPAELLAAARRCLSGAQASGGNCVKSIDL